jgi:hypothetical protein
MCHILRQCKMLCVCIWQIRMHPWRSYHLPYRLTDIQLKKYVSTALTIFYFTFNYFVQVSFFSTLSQSYLFLMNQFLTTASTEAGSIFDELQSCLSTQHGELTVFAKEVRNVCA